MSRRQRVWVHAPKPVPLSPAEKATITARCEAFLAEVLLPRVPPPMHDWNYPIGLRGAWHGAAYRFIQRWRTSGRQGPLMEFDVPCARLQHMGHGRFDLACHRHTGEWWVLARGLTLEQCLQEIGSNPLLQPTAAA